MSSYFDFFNRFRGPPEVVKLADDTVEPLEIPYLLRTNSSDEVRLKSVIVTMDMDKKEKRLAEAYNNTIDRLNLSVYGPENYAAIGKK